MSIHFTRIADTGDGTQLLLVAPNGSILESAELELFEPSERRRLIADFRSRAADLNQSAATPKDDTNNKPKEN